MSITLVVTVTPNPDAMEDMKAYLGGVAPLLINGGGTLLHRGKITKALEGGVNFGMLLVMNFETEEAIEKIFKSQEYKKLIPFRDKGFKQVDIVTSVAL